MVGFATIKSPRPLPPRVSLAYLIPTITISDSGAIPRYFKFGEPKPEPAAIPATWVPWEPSSSMADAMLIESEYSVP